jgi:hypothetical protein
MGQFKPMVKMETTEPSVELKLKKGGKVVKKADGGMMGSPMSAAGAMPPSMPARGGMPGGMAPMKPSLAMRRRAMKGLPSGAGPAGPVGGAAAMQASMPPPPAPTAPPMKKGGKAEGGESKAMHKSEMKAIKGVKSELKSHAGKPASKGHKGLATGGVVDGQGGYKAGGIINTENQGGEYRNTKMHTAKADNSPAKTGGVKEGNGGGYATGGVAKANGGGYKKGGAPKKAYAAGGTVDSGRPVAMPQGDKKPSSPVSISKLSGTFKKGGSVTPAEGRLQKNFKSENATAMKQAKAFSNEVYSKYGKKMKEGGLTDLSKGAYDKSIGPDEDDMGMARSIRSFPGKVFSKVKNVAKDLFSSEPKADSVTKTKESVTVTPAKKRGGSVKC